MLGHFLGGNPIAARAGIAVLETIERENLLPRAKALGEIFRNHLQRLADESDVIQEVRVLGTMIGVELTMEVGPVVQACLDRRVLVNGTQGNVLRLLPAITLSEEQAAEGLGVIEEVLKSQHSS